MSITINCLQVITLKLDIEIFADVIRQRILVRGVEDFQHHFHMSSAAASKGLIFYFSQSIFTT